MFDTNNSSSPVSSLYFVTRVWQKAQQCTRTTKWRSVGGRKWRRKQNWAEMCKEIKYFLRNFIICYSVWNSCSYDLILKIWNASIDDHFSRKMIFLFNHRKIMDTLSRRNSDKLSYFSNIGNKQINSESKFWILESRIGC